MHIIIVRNNFNADAVDASITIASYLSAQNISYEILDVSDLPHGAIEKGALDGGCACDMAISLGGDGTLLSAASLIAYSGVSILGINYGNLGYLTNDSKNGLINLVCMALSGETTCEKRTNLEVEIVLEGDDIDKTPFMDEHSKTNFALNELALSRGESGSILNFELSISGNKITNMRGDGLIIASATGSTAYALSAGGPLVSPDYSGLLVVPLALHSLISRSILCSPSDIIEILVPEKQIAKPSISLDGKMLAFDRDIKKVFVKKGSSETSLLKAGGEDFYAQLARVFYK